MPSCAWVTKYKHWMGQPVTSAKDVQAAIGRHRGGDALQIDLQRGNQTGRKPISPA
jgi:hypothetical protein